MTASFIATQAGVTGAGTWEPRSYPAFDPQHPDEEILTAYENVRENREWSYAQEDINGAEWPKGAAEKLDEVALHIEGFVTGNWATTPAGIAARLSLAIVEIEQARWVDRCIMENGLRALFLRRDELDGAGKQVAQAAHELQCLDWQSAVDQYEQAKPSQQLALNLLDAVAELRRHHPALDARLIDLDRLVAENERATCIQGHVDRVMKTLVVEPDELPRKIEILAAEGVMAEAAPWLLRDVAYLNGELAPSRLTFVREA